MEDFGAKVRVPRANKRPCSGRTRVGDDKAGFYLLATLSPSLSVIGDLTVRLAVMLTVVVLLITVVVL